MAGSVASGFNSVHTSIEKIEKRKPKGDPFRSCFCEEKGANHTKGSLVTRSEVLFFSFFAVPHPSRQAYLTFNESKSGEWEKPNRLVNLSQITCYCLGRHGGSTRNGASIYALTILNASTREPNCWKNLHCGGFQTCRRAHQEVFLRGHPPIREPPSLEPEASERASARVGRIDFVI